MAKEHISNLLNNFSIEVTPNAAKKIDKFSDHLTSGTLTDSPGRPLNLPCRLIPVFSLPAYCAKISPEQLRKLI